MASWKSIFVAILIIYLGYKVYQVPTPEGASQRIRLRLQFAGLELFIYTSEWLDYLGVVDEVSCLRWGQELQSKWFSATIDDVEFYDMSVDGVLVRVFTPHRQGDNRPGMVYFHGGGYVMGNVRTHTAPAAYMAKNANMIVLSVEYGLSPEHTKKEGFMDCVKVTEYLIHNAEKYGVDRERIVVGGDSAGGNIAAGVSLYLRDTKVTPLPRLQVLIYPAVQNIDMQLPSYQQNANGPGLTIHLLCLFRSYIYSSSKAYMEYFRTNTHVPSHVRVAMADGVINHDIIPEVNKYLPYKKPNIQNGGTDIWEKIKDRLFDGYSSPLLAETHRGLPEAYIFTSQHDPLRDDGYLYAHKLRQDGVQVTHYNCQVCWHGIINAVAKQQDATDAMDKIVDFLNSKLHVKYDDGKN